MLATEDYSEIHSHLNLSDANPAYDHKEGRRSTGHQVMVASRYSNQKGFENDDVSSLDITNRK